MSDLPIDDATMKAIVEASNQYGTRIRAPKKQADPQEEAQSLPLEMTKFVAPRKRPAPKNTNKPTSPGIRKPPPKRRRIDTQHTLSTSARPPLAVPSVSTRPSKATPKVSPNKSSKSATPVGSSPAARAHSDTASEIASDVEDGAPLYCICKRPDNHTWMIGCDGGCEDWFHGNCVNIKQEDEDLIDKYICSGCKAKERGVTTWKPMCRRDGCRKPARLKKGGESKYCSGECGVAFIKENLKRSSALDASVVTALKPRTKARGGGDSQQDNDDNSKPDLGPLGGPIRVHELNYLAKSTANVADFRRLGSAGVLTPPASVSPEQSCVPRAAGVETSQRPLQEINYTATEHIRLDEIEARKAALRLRRTLLKDRERFVVLVKERVARVIEKFGFTICGFDGRLSWDDRTFELWRATEAGKVAFDRGRLNIDQEEDDIAEAMAEAIRVETDKAEQSKLKPKPKPVLPEPGVHETNVGPTKFCSQTTCGRHQRWQKLALQDVGFEEADVGDEMRRIDAEEKEIRNRAELRTWMRKGSRGDGDGGVLKGVDGYSNELEHDNEIMKSHDIDLLKDGHMQSSET